VLTLPVWCLVGAVVGMYTRGILSFAIAAKAEKVKAEKSGKGKRKR